MTSRKLIEHALAYAQYLGRVFDSHIPTNPEEPKTFRPKRAWKQDATTDPATIEKWFGRNDVNIVVTCRPGLILLDVDPDGFASLEALEQKHGKLPETLTAKTPRGGNHYWFRIDPDIPVQNQVGGKHGAPYVGLDIRVAGDPEKGGERNKPGCAIAPPSKRPDGSYSWINWDGLSDSPDIAYAPQWLVTYAKSRPKPKATKAAAIAGTPIEDHTRNDMLISEAGRLQRIGVCEDAIFAHLQVQNETRCTPPLPDNDVRTIAASAARYEADFTPEMSAPPSTWTARIDEAGVDAKTMKAIVRALALDTALEDTEQAQLVKHASKVARVPVQMLRNAQTEAIREHLKATESETRTVIDISPGKQGEAVRAAIGVLGKLPYVRIWGGQLVDITGGNLRAIERPRLTTILSDAAVFYAGDSRRDPPENLVKGILAEPELPGVPIIMEYHRQPCALGNVTTPGHHAGGIEALFDPAKFPVFKRDPEMLARVPEALRVHRYPPVGEVRLTAGEALSQLRWLLSGWNFCTKLDESCALAMLLTAVARPALPTAPAFLLNALKSSSGKSHLAVLVGAFAQEKKLRAAAWRQGKEQIDGIESKLLTAPAAIWIDNIQRTSEIYSDRLATSLTEDGIEFRKKGGNEIAETDLRTLWLFTGNSLSVKADMTRRFLTVNLLPHKTVAEITAIGAPANPVALVKANRGYFVQLVNAVLADKSDVIFHDPELSRYGSFSRDYEPLDSYHEWHHAVRRLLVVAGLPDPVESIKAQQANDPEAREYAGLGELWFRRFQIDEKGKTLRQAYDLVRHGTDEASQALHHVMCDLAPRGNTNECDIRALGYKLRGAEAFGAFRLRTQPSSAGVRYSFEPILVGDSSH